MSRKVKVNADGVLPHERDVRPLEDALLRGAPRAVVVRLAANQLVLCFEIDVLVAIVDQGFDRFRDVAREHWHVHGFTDDDYRTAFGIVQEAMTARLKRIGSIH